MGFRRLRRAGRGPVGPCWVLLLAGLAGCGAKSAQISVLVAEGRANQLRALVAHRDERLTVQGVVIGVGMKKVRTLQGQTEVVGAGNWAVGSWSAREGSTGFPYVLARDPAQSDADGQLLCFFAPDDLDIVATLDPGAQVSLTGEFQEYSKEGTRVVLNSCELD